MRVPFSFLTEQFADSDKIFDNIKNFLKRCDFTLGEDLSEFENNYKQYTGAKHAIGVGSGTDALALSLKYGAGVEAGDEVITPANSFIATTGAVIQVGGVPKWVDIGADENIDVSKIEPAITEKTKAILPVYWGGACPDMEAIMKIAQKHQLAVVEDSCQALGCKIGDTHAGNFGVAGGFSCHPLKPLHVWGDGGVIVTNDDALNEKLRLVRNHGMESRDVIACYGVNSRFDNLHAIVGNVVFNTLDDTINSRIKWAQKYDAAFQTSKYSDFIEVPKRIENTKHVFHLYKVKAKKRDELLEFLKGQGIEAKVHYPIPLHLQPAAKQFGHAKGDFPETERECDTTVTFPCHQYLSEEQIQFTIDKVSEFYGV